MNSKRALLSKTGGVHQKGMFSACCLVSDWEQYEQHYQALIDKGFDECVCEYLICDNTAKNEFDAFEAIRLFVASAKGEYILIAHQDTAPLENADKLFSLIQELTIHDPSWGVIGNAGKAMDSPIDADMHIDMPLQSARITSPFIRVDSLDENILIVRNGTGITVSSNLHGFHFYGADICLIAERLGYSSYVAQFLWRHKSNGTLDKEFFKLKQTFEEHLHRHRVKTSLPTTCTVLCWSDSPRLRGKAAVLAKSIRRENEHQLLSSPGSLLWSALYTLTFSFCQAYYDLVSITRSAFSRVIGDVRWWRSNWKQRLLVSGQKRPSDAESL